jgi:hypothetical protein
MRICLMGNFFSEKFAERCPAVLRIEFEGLAAALSFRAST